MLKKESFSYEKIVSLILIGVLLYIFINSPDKRHDAINVFEPLLIAFAMAYLLDNSVCWFERNFKISRGKSVLLTFIILIFVVFYAGVIGIPNLVDTTTNLFNTISNVKDINLDFMDKIFANLDHEYVTAIKDFIYGSVEDIFIQMRQSTGTILKGVLSWTSSLFNAIISLVIAVYMLLDKKDLLARLKRIVYAFGTNEHGNELVRICKKANDIFSSFLIGKIIDSAIIGVLCIGILAVLDIPFYSIIGLIVGITNMIPYFGPFIGAIPAVLITLVNSPMQALWVLIVIVLLQQFDGLILGPWILGDKVGVRPFWIITAVTLGGTMFGVLGMFLGVPVLVLAKTLLEEIVDTRLNEKQMGNLEIENMAPIRSKKKKKIFKKVK